MKTAKHSIKCKWIKSKWGSNQIDKKKIIYSNNLVFFEPAVIDSVIIHELAHYFEANHSKDFYKIVNLFLPNYKKIGAILNPYKKQID
jgi:predicted metal-dependent hydrolase